MGGGESKEKDLPDDDAKPNKDLDQAQQFHKLVTKFDELSKKKALEDDSKQAIADRAQLRKDVGTITHYLAQSLSKSPPDAEDSD